MDSFHIILSALLQDHRDNLEKEHIRYPFALLDLRVTSPESFHHSHSLSFYGWPGWAPNLEKK